MKNLRLIKDIYKASPSRIWLEVLAIVGQLLNSMLVQVILVKMILDLVISGEFQKAIFVVLFAAIADFVFSVFERWMNYVYRKKDNIRLHEQFQKKLYQSAVKVRLTYYDNPKYYDQFILAAKNGDIQAVQFLDTLKEGIVTVAEILISGGLIVTNLNSLLWIVLTASTLYAVVSGKFAKERVAMKREQNPYEKKCEYVKRLFFLKKYAVDLRNQKLSERIFRMFDTAHKEEIAVMQPYMKRITLLDVMTGILFYFQYLAIIVVLSWRAMTVQDISVGDFSMLLSSAMTLANNWRFFGNLISRLKEHRMFAEQYYEFVELAETEEELLAGKEMPSEIEAIEANKVTFQYEEQGKKIFAELSLRLKRGDKIALVGPNGAGKSTFVNLLLNLYQPQNGILTCNGEDIREYEQEAYRNRFSLIFQESNLYPCSVEENLLFRKCVDETEKRRLYEVLDKVGLGEKVRKLPFGLQTPVTKEFDKNGVVFSGGECQRMALARAILQDAAIFVMDEPSSALDPEMELQLNKLFTEVLKDKTLLIISHRISTIAGVDYIYMLNQGQVAEAGTHQELMKKNGDYAKIYRAQEELYRIG